MIMSNRREFLKTLVAGGGAALLSRIPDARAVPLWSSPADGPWEILLPQILSRIKAPTFLARDLDITKFGAQGDGKFDCTDAFRTAIAACNHAGGGRVLVPAGR